MRKARQTIFLMSFGLAGQPLVKRNAVAKRVDATLSFRVLLWARMHHFGGHSIPNLGNHAPFVKNAKGFFVIAVN
jgi:hypothetical protein